jgi:putative glutamine amidotransferase
MNQQPPRIGIPARIQHPVQDGQNRHSHAYHFLEQTLAHWVMSHGAMLFMIPSLCEACLSTGKVLERYNYAGALDGLILQGGPDIAPQLYGDTPRYPDWAGDIQHDTHQLHLFRQFFEAKKPILGICRGAQLINVALGGTLYQDISTELPYPEKHGRMKLETVIHEVEWEVGSGLASLYPGQRQGAVLSIHHQAIKEIGRGLSVDARSAKDGVIEAIRLQDSAYVVGLQWHPECHSGNSKLLDCNPILNEYLAAARMSSESFQRK